MYSCRWCDFKLDLKAADIHKIIEHDRTHPENDIDVTSLRLSADYDDKYKPKCSWCGCEEEHGD